MARIDLSRFDDVASEISDVRLRLGKAAPEGRVGLAGLTEEVRLLAEAVSNLARLVRDKLAEAAEK